MTNAILWERLFHRKTIEVIQIVPWCIKTYPELNTASAKTVEFTLFMEEDGPKKGCIHVYYMASSLSGQDEPNRAL